MRQGAVIFGMGNTPDSTILIRSFPSNADMLTVPSGVSGVWIKNLEFNGNRQLFDGGCPPYNNYVYDVEVFGQAVVDTVYFFFAPGQAIGLHSSSAIENSWVYFPRITGIWLFDSSWAINNTIQYAGTAGINVSGLGGNTVTYNQLFSNRYEMPDGAGGGQLFTAIGSQNATIAENVIIGNNWRTGSSPVGSPYFSCSPPQTPQTVGGIEAYGHGHHFYNNAVSQHTASGIALAGTDSVTVSGYDPGCGSCSQKSISLSGFHGLRVYPTPTGGNNYYVTLDHIRSDNDAPNGVDITGPTTGTGFTRDACINNPQNVRVYWNTPTSWTNPYPATGTQCP
jgi:hypothetical protein